MLDEFYFFCEKKYDEYQKNSDIQKVSHLQKTTIGFVFLKF